MTHFVCSFSKNSGDASSHQTLPGAPRCVPTELMSSNKAESYLQEKGHGNDRGSHKGWSSVLRPLYRDLLKMKKSGVMREILTEKGVVTG